MSIVSSEASNVVVQGTPKTHSGSYIGSLTNQYARNCSYLSMCTVFVRP